MARNSLVQTLLFPPLLTWPNASIISMLSSMLNFSILKPHRPIIIVASCIRTKADDNLAVVCDGRSLCPQGLPQATILQLEIDIGRSAERLRLSDDTMPVNPYASLTGQQDKGCTMHLFSRMFMAHPPQEASA